MFVFFLNITLLILCILHTPTLWALHMAWRKQNTRRAGRENNYVAWHRSSFNYCLIGHNLPGSESGSSKGSAQGKECVSAFENLIYANESESESKSWPRAEHISHFSEPAGCCPRAIHQSYPFQTISNSIPTKSMLRLDRHRQQPLVATNVKTISWH